LSYEVLSQRCDARVGCGVRLFQDEVERSSHLNQLLGVGIAVFQGLSNIALNGMCLFVCVNVCLTLCLCL